MFMGRHVSSGPLSAFEAGYVQWLVERGFRPGAVADRLGQFRALSRWLDARGLPVAELDPEGVEEFLDARRVAGAVVGRSSTREVPPVSAARAAPRGYDDRWL